MGCPSQLHHRCHSRGMKRVKKFELETDVIAFKGRLTAIPSCLRQQSEQKQNLRLFSTTLTETIIPVSLCELSKLQWSDPLLDRTNRIAATRYPSGGSEITNSIARRPSQSSQGSSNGRFKQMMRDVFSRPAYWKSEICLFPMLSSQSFLVE